MKDKIKFAVGTVGIDLDLGLKLEVFGLFGLHFFLFLPHNSYKVSFRASESKIQLWILSSRSGLGIKSDGPLV